MAWITLNNGFYSIVQHPTDKNLLQVRARREGDLERLFPRLDVIELDGRDYSFRVYATRLDVAAAFADKIAGIGYGNFKDSIKDKALKSACSAVWSIMAKLQKRAPYASRRGRGGLFDYQRDAVAELAETEPALTAPRGSTEAALRRELRNADAEAPRTWPFPK